MKTGIFFRGIWAGILIAGAISLYGCNGNDNRYVILYENIQPKQAAEIGSLLDEFHEINTMTMGNNTFTIKVPQKRINLIKHYMTAPVDSERYISLVQTALLAQRDSVKTVSQDAVKASGRLKRIVTPPTERSDSLRIGAAFDRTFENSSWRCYRTPDYKIHVEFSGNIPSSIRSNPEEMSFVMNLTDNREPLLLEIGPARSLWKFRWLMGIDGLSFKKESTRVIPGRFRPEGGKPPRESESISL
ncbi:MAG: hypothetical protein WCU00_00545 [Candidatus Latescibacterota bacterium]